eukprot:99513_1
MSKHTMKFMHIYFSLLILLFDMSISSISWTDVSQLPTSIDPVNMVSGSINDQLIYIFFTSSDSDYTIYKKNFSQGLNANWMGLALYNATNSPQDDLECDFSKCSATIHDRYIYIYNKLHNDYPINDEFVIYTFDTMQEEWLSLVINVPNYASAACMTSDNSHYLYLIGGRSLDHYVTLDFIQIYDINNNNWSIVDGIEYPSYYASCVYYNNYLYYFGGYNEQRYTQDDIQIYDLINGVWKSSNISKLPMGLSHMRSIVGADNLVYIIGGITITNHSNRVYNVNACINAVQVYNPTTDLFGITTCLSEPRANSMVEIVNSEIVICGGRKDNWEQVKTCIQSKTLILNQTNAAPSNQSSTKNHSLSRSCEEIQSHQSLSKELFVDLFALIAMIMFVICGVFILVLYFYIQKQKSRLPQHQPVVDVDNDAQQITPAVNSNEVQITSHVRMEPLK